MSPLDPDGLGTSFRIETAASSGARSIEAFGELDSGSSGALLEAFERAVDGAGAVDVSLDLRGVSFIDSTGMRTMIQIERLAHERGIALMLVPPPDDVTELLRAAGIAEHMQVASDTDSGQLGPDFSDRVDLELEREPHAPSRARAEVREALDGRLDDADIATVVLLTSELVTNAVIHPDAPEDRNMALRLWVYDAGIRVEVEDPGDGFDPKNRSSSSRHGGRGLFLVERCALNWGARRTENEQGGRFCVWFEFLGDDRQGAAVSG
jgi:anti-anti-sigma factor